MSNPMSNNGSERRTEVTLIKDGLRHQGQPRRTGDKIQVTDRQIAFLAKRGFIAEPKGGKAATTAAPKGD